VGVGQKLPWGKDITVKTLDKHLPFLLKVFIPSLDLAHFINCSLSYLLVNFVGFLLIILRVCTYMGLQ